MFNKVITILEGVKVQWLLVFSNHTQKLPIGVARINILLGAFFFQNFLLFGTTLFSVFCQTIDFFKGQLISKCPFHTVSSQIFCSFLVYFSKYSWYLKNVLNDQSLEVNNSKYTPTHSLVQWIGSERKICKLTVCFWFLQIDQKKQQNVLVSKKRSNQKSSLVESK